MLSAGFSPRLREHLLKLCGLLGSDFDGERAAAARKVTSLMRRAGLSWDEVLANGADPGTADPAPKPERRGGHGFADWRADLAFCRRHAHALNAAELEYVAELVRILHSGRTGLRATDLTRLAATAKRLRREAATMPPGAQARPADKAWAGA